MGVGVSEVEEASSGSDVIQMRLIGEWLRIYARDWNRLE